MVLDYKDVSFSFQKRRQRRRRRYIRLSAAAAVLAAVLAALLYFADWRRLNSAREALSLRGAAAPPPRPGLFHRPAWRELQALHRLMQGDEAGATAVFRRDGAFSVSRFGDEGFFRWFADRGLYRSLRVFLQHRRPPADDPLHWYRAQGFAAFCETAAARREMDLLSPAFRRTNTRALAIVNRLLAEVERGRVVCIRDRRGQPAAEYVVAERRLRSLLPGFYCDEFEPLLQQGLRFFTLTLDGALQARLAALFQGRGGTCLLLELEESGVVAAFSQPLAGPRRNAAFDQLFPSGAVMEAVTLLEYEKSPEPGLFPFSCTGNLSLENRLFYDRAAHGTLADPKQALAVSCHSAFARMGLALGYDRLAAALRALGFQGEAFSDYLFTFPAGTFSPGARTPYRLAALATGAEGVQCTVFHAAVAAARLVPGDPPHRPFLVDNVKNILDLGWYNHRAQSFPPLAGDTPLGRVQEAMAAVVEDPAGTMRHAAVDFLRLAVKSGVSGDEGDVVLLGHFPMEQPRYAFALRLERVNRSEYEGAVVLNGILQAFRPQQ